METKVCSKCGEEKELSEYYHQHKRGKAQASCKQCTRKKNVEFYHRTIERYHAARKEYREQNREYYRNTENARYTQLKSEMLIAFGGQCSCCGEKEPLFLELGHVNDDGFTHRKTTGRGSKAMYFWARKQGWPKDKLQLLCANCNQGKKRNHGICPHKKGS